VGNKEDVHMKLQLTAVFEKVPEGYIGYVEELPGANTQAETLDEARESLAEAVKLVLGANRELAEERLADRDVMREPLSITA
jgi:predicted RNase H-like HicB family nuclease